MTWAPFCVPPPLTPPLLAESKLVLTFEALPDGLENGVVYLEVVRGSVTSAPVVSSRAGQGVDG